MNETKLLSVTVTVDHV